MVEIIEIVEKISNTQTIKKKKQQNKKKQTLQISILMHI